jgi:hypothetical protein
VIKSIKSCSIISDLEEIFNNLRHFNIKVNPRKCTFGVPQGKLLGYIITECGIEANPNEISAVTEMGLIKDIQ